MLEGKAGRKEKKRKEKDEDGERTQGSKRRLARDWKILDVHSMKGSCWLRTPIKTLKKQACLKHFDIRPATIEWLSCGPAASSYVWEL